MDNFDIYFLLFFFNFIFSGIYIVLKMALESHAQATEDVLHESLSFKLRPSASYVIDRKFVTFWPQGGSEYKVAGGVKVI